MRSRRAQSWAVLVVGVLVIALAAWLVRRDAATGPTSGPGASAGASADGASGSTAAAAPTPVPITQASGPATAPPAAPTTPPAPGWLAHWIIDGDTLDIEKDGAVVRLRLLNIDAPERRTAEHGPQCLAEAATTLMTELAPKGTELGVVEIGHDRYGRTLGEAWLPDGRMLGAEIVRAGLAAPVTIGGQDRYRADMDSAQADAAAAARGLHDPKENCTLPAHVVALEGRAHGIPADDTAARTQLATDADAVLTDLTAARPRAGVAALTAAERDDLIARARAVVAATRP